MGAPTWENVFEMGNLFGKADLLSLASLAIQSQYAASPHMNALMRGFQDKLDAGPQLDLIFDDIININTATGVSLDVWGRILAIPRTLNTKDAQITWPDETYRFLLLYKALANISSADAETQNRLLTELFAQNVYVLDNQNMTIRVVFEFFPSEEQAAILNNYGLLSRGAGVGWEFYQIVPEETFGFEGSGLQPFNQAPFDPCGLRVMTKGIANAAWFQTAAT